MNLRAWAEAIGVIGIIASVGLLTMELNQANSLGRFTASTEIVTAANEGNIQVASNPDLADLLALLVDEQAVLTARQVQQATAFAYWVYNGWLIGEKAYREDLLGRDDYQAVLNDIHATLTQWPGLKPCLRDVVRYAGANRQLFDVEKKILEIAGGS